MNIYTSYASEENLERLRNSNCLPIIILRNIRNSRLLRPYADSCIHLRELSPSTELYNKFKSGLIGVEEYHYSYLLELLDSNISTYDIYGKLKILSELCDNSDIALLGYSEDPELCHRSALAKFLGQLWKVDIVEWKGN